MLISGYNMEYLLDPDSDSIAEERLEIERQIAANLREQKACQQLKQKIEELICKMYSKDELKEIQLYKEAIFSYLNDNGKANLVNNISALSSCISIYYRVLKRENVSLEEYAFLQSFSRTSENERTKKMKKLLVSKATEKCTEQGIELYGDDSIKAINENIHKTIEQSNIKLNIDPYLPRKIRILRK